AVTETGMSAVIGADETELLATLEALGLSPANMNGGGQIVVAGEVAALARLKDNPPAGARVIPLQVAGAFHTRFMEPAVATMRELASGIGTRQDRKSTRLNSSHVKISYAVFCLKKKKQ